MGLLSKLFNSGSNDKPGLCVKEIKKLTPVSVQITFDVPHQFKKKYHFIPGQFIAVHAVVDGKKHIRSYSICSSTTDELSIGVKKVDGGIVSTYLVEELKVGDILEIDAPSGKFTLNKEEKTIVAFAAGSGITPILSIAGSLEKTDKRLRLFYGNKSLNETMFDTKLNGLNNTSTIFTYSQETVENADFGRLDKVKVSELIKRDLTVLRADVFLICGPEQMIVDTIEVLKTFGVTEDKLRFELFTTPVQLIEKEQNSDSSNFEGESAVTVLIDGEKHEFNLANKGKSILDALDALGADVPYSCRGGVCCTCRAKVVEGSASMRVNYALTEQEVSNGYILTCQAHPTSKTLKIDFDA